MFLVENGSLYAVEREKSVRSGIGEWAPLRLNQIFVDTGICEAVGKTFRETISDGFKFINQEAKSSAEIVGSQDRDLKGAMKIWKQL